MLHILSSRSGTYRLSQNEDTSGMTSHRAKYSGSMDDGEGERVGVETRAMAGRMCLVDGYRFPISALLFLFIRGRNEWRSYAKRPLPVLMAGRSGGRIVGV